MDSSENICFLILIHVGLSKALMGSISKRKSSGSVFQVASYYSQEPRIRYVEEQPELPALLKLVAKRSMLAGDRRKNATRKKSTDKNFWWACGHCFFERQKKSTIRAHLIQEVCRKPRLQRQMSKRIRSVSELEHRSELDKYRHDSWKRSISI